jgi:hypothetical protein
MHHNLAADLVCATGGNPFPGVGRTGEVTDLSERCK